MRDVLYRAKPKNLSAYVDAVREQIAWVYGSPLVNRCNGLSVQIFEQRNGKLYNWEVDPETLGQWTGLTDKNGKKIFEGDIIDYEDEAPGQYEYHDNLIINRGVIKYSEGCFYWTNAVSANLLDSVYKNVAECEIIGNIHDNPELLRA